MLLISTIIVFCFHYRRLLLVGSCNSLMLKWPMNTIYPAWPKLTEFLLSYTFPVFFCGFDICRFLQSEVLWHLNNTFSFFVTLHRCTLRGLLGIAFPLWGDRALGNEQTHLPSPRRKKKDSTGTTWLGKVERCWLCVGELIHLDNGAAEGSHSDVTLGYFGKRSPCASVCRSTTSFGT